MKTRRNDLFRVLSALLFLASCTTPQPRVASGDATDGPRLARTAGAILLQLAAYDHAVAGGIMGEKARVVSPERYGAVGRAVAKQINALSSDTVGATADRAGPIRDRLLALADGLAVLGRDVTTYSDGAEPAALARVIAGVTTGWQRLRDLAAVLSDDEQLGETIERGTKFTVTSHSVRVYALIVGPFSSKADADAAAKRVGQVESVSERTPFVVRVATYGDRAAAQAAAASLAAKGFTTHAITEEDRYTFTRGPVAPDAELWREPFRVFDTAGSARRVAIAPNGQYLATGSDDGTLAIFSSSGVLRALPKFPAGVSFVVFSDDGAFLLAGAQTLTTVQVPSGAAVGTPVRLTTIASQVLFVPAARAFVAAAKGPTGQSDGGPGVVAGRAPDGEPLDDPFPLVAPAAGAAIAASGRGELYVATAARGGGTDLEVFRVGTDSAVRAVMKLPGSIRTLILDASGTRGASLGDQGVLRFGPKDADPPKTISQVGPATARDIAFGPDGTLYVLETTRLVAIGPQGSQRWTVPLLDGKRLVVGRRAIVLDGADRVIAVDGSGAVDELGAGGIVQDLVVSPDGSKVAALVDSRRAVLFTLP